MSGLGVESTDVAEDVPMEDVPNGGGDSEEEEGEATMKSNPSEDSSEEEDEDEEEARKIQEGFIVDDVYEDEDEAGGGERDESRRKKKHRRRAPELEDDDLDLLYENTGTRIEPSRKLKRIHRGRRVSASPPRASSSKQRSVRYEDEEMEDVAEDALSPADLQGIWDDDRATRVRRRALDEDEDGELEDGDDMAGFIEDEDDEELGELNEAEREEREAIRRKEKERRKAMGGRPEFAGIDQGAWDEIYDVFGDGTDYDWALDDGDEGIFEDAPKPEMRYQDVFEPSEIKARLLTEDDDLIRAQDIPERMQLATSALSTSATLSLHPPFSPVDLDEAAEWVALRLGSRTEQTFFRPTGSLHHLIGPFIGAVRHTIDCLLLQNMEVPYIYVHKTDNISHFDPNASVKRVELLNVNELWRVYSLSQKFRALVERKKGLEASYERTGIKDPYFENDIRPIIDSVEVVADTTEWLTMRHKTQKQDAWSLDMGAEDGEDRKRKMPSRVSAYELAKKSLISDLADDFGIKPQAIVANFFSKSKRNFVEDSDFPPSTYAARFAKQEVMDIELETETTVTPAERALARARLIIATELGKDPLLRRDIRSKFKIHAEVSVDPTDKGLNKVDEYHPYYAFKYLKDKPIAEFERSSQFLHILGAEAEHLVTVSITLRHEIRTEFLTGLTEAFSSDSYSDTAKLWNEQRELVCKEVLDKHLYPVGVKYVRELLREESEDYLARKCGDELERRIKVKPKGTDEFGDPPSVLAVSWGEGDPKKDVITTVFLDHAGRLRDHMRVDNLSDDGPRQEFLDMVRQRKPDVIVVGGFTVNTKRLYDRIRELIGHPPPDDKKKEGEGGNGAGAPTDSWGAPTGGGGAAWGQNDGSGWGSSQVGADNGPHTGPSASPERSHDRRRDDADELTPVCYVQDEVARVYQHSKRAKEEFSALTDIARYCVGFARYWQSPLTEYAALGSDLTAITFDEDGQQLVPKDKLLTALERALLNVVNTVGVDINRAVNDSYYQHLLQFVSGLGPRKAQVVVNRISAIGTLVNREQFVKGQIMTTQIWLNAAGFLRIPYDLEYRAPKQRSVGASDIPDPLDATRIHPGDYELARKMAADALDVDEEDYEEEHPSTVVTMFMKNDYKEKTRQLELLNLDDFAVNLLETQQESKRHALDVIHRELLDPFKDDRPLPPPLTMWEVVTMLSGETPKTLRDGLIVSVQVLRVKQNFVIVKLASGIEGIINASYLVDGEHHVVPDTIVKVGQTIAGVIIDIKIEGFMVELSSRPGDILAGDGQYRRVLPDPYYDTSKASHDRDILQRKKRSEVNQVRRVIKHPNFHNFNAPKAEEYLSTQQRGDVVIRPSSKGHDHLAVTWKVDDGVYQHIDVIEPNADASQTTVGHQLIIEGQGVFSDLDELIVNHVKAMARKVEELMAHEKYKGASEEALHTYLQEFVRANPTKSIYAFGLNRRKPGYFNLSFMANRNSPIQTWSVKVTPMAYVLFDTTLPTIPQLCDAFKTRYSQQGQKGVHLGGKTPFGAGRGAMTPGGARTPGRATPGHMSVRHPALGKTPNPYQQPAPVPTSVYQQQQPSGYGGGYPAATPGGPPAGWNTPAPGGAPAPPGFQAPPGMNPARAAQMIAMNAPAVPSTNSSNGAWGNSNSSGWGNSSGGGWAT